MPMPKQEKRSEAVDRRVSFIALGLVIALGLLVLRLWNLQVVQGEYYAHRSDEERDFAMRIKPPRGTIYGRNGADDEVMLADTRGTCDLVFVPRMFDDPYEALDDLERLIDFDYDRVRMQIDQAIDKREPFRHIVVRRDLPKNDITRVEEWSYRLPGVFTAVRPQRRYLYGETGGQILGYVGEISPDELETRQDLYKQGDQFGKSGLELIYEEVLHGTAGQLWVSRYAGGRGVPQFRRSVYDQGSPFVQDLLGRRLEPERYIEPQYGGALHTTIDIGLQRHAEEVLGEEVGSIVVLNAKTGEVLCLASTPTFDPNAFVDHGRASERMELLNDNKNKPMLNRAYQAMYPPGSVFKIAMAIAALEEGVVTPQTTHSCSGIFTKMRGYSPRCWRKRLGGHGSVEILEAIYSSCDIYFYEVGLELGIDRIHKWAVSYTHLRAHET